MNVIVSTEKSGETSIGRILAIFNLGNNGRHCLSQEPVAARVQYQRVSTSESLLQLFVSPTSLSLYPLHNICSRCDGFFVRPFELLRPSLFRLPSSS